MVQAVANVDHGDGHGLMTPTEQLPAAEWHRTYHRRSLRAGNFSHGKLERVDERDATRILAFLGRIMVIV